MSIQYLLSHAGVAGLEEFEVYYQKSESTSLTVFDQQVDSFVVSEKSGYALRGLKNGKVGTSYCEDDSEASLELALKQCAQNAELIDSDDTLDLQGPQKYKEYSSEFNLDTLDTEVIIESLKQLEKEAKEIDKRIRSVNACSYSQSCTTIHIANTKGLNAERKEGWGVAYLSVVAEDKGDQKSGMEFQAFQLKEEMNFSHIAAKAVEEAVAKLHAGKVPSGNYPMILHNEVSADLLGAMQSMFAADIVQKELSVLKGKKGTQAFSPLITVKDEPLMAKGYASSSFDDEGTPCFNKTVVEKGILTQYLYDLKSAAKEGCASSGNGFKGGIHNGMSVSGTNFYISPDEKSLEDMIQSIEKGLLITDIQGLHAGLNSITANFSLQANGFYVENGKIIKPVNLITIAGNYLELLNHITTVGNDLKFNLSGIGSPSLLVSTLALSGE